MRSRRQRTLRSAATKSWWSSGAQTRPLVIQNVPATVALMHALQRVLAGIVFCHGSRIIDVWSTGSVHQRISSESSPLECLLSVGLSVPRGRWWPLGEREVNAAADMHRLEVFEDALAWKPSRFESPSRGHFHMGTGFLQNLIEKLPVFRTAYAPLRVGTGVLWRRSQRPASISSMPHSFRVYVEALRGQSGFGRGSSNRCPARLELAGNYS